MNKNNTICKVCNKELPKKGLGRHLKKHNILPKEYYDKYFKQENEGICPTCGKPTNFNSISTGYHKFCSISCSRQFWVKNEEFNKKAGEKISQSWHNKSQEEKDKIIEQRVTTFNKRSQEWIKQNCSKAGKAKWTKLTKEEKNIEIQKLSNRQKI